MDKKTDVAAVEVIEPLVAAFAMALNTTFQVLVSRKVISGGEAKALLETMADTLQQEYGGEPSSTGVDLVVQLIKASADTFKSPLQLLDS